MRILIITEYITPVRAIASIRWTKLGKYLNRDYSHEIDVLTCRKSFDGGNESLIEYTYDNSISDDLKYFNSIFELPDTVVSRTAISFYNFLKRMFKPEETSNADNKYNSSGNNIPDPSDNLKRVLESYADFCAKGHISSAKKMPIDWNAYDLVISTYGPKWTHQIAKNVKMKCPNLPWIADYRDCPVDGDINKSNYYKEFASKITGNADCVIAVSDPMEDKLMLRKGQRYITIFNGFDGEEVASRMREKTDKFILSYAGTLYTESTYTRDLKPIFKCLSSLIKEGKINADDIIVSYCGLSGDEFLKQSSPYTLVQSENLGLIPREDVLKLQNKSSLLLFNTCNNEDNKDVMTGKIYECVSSAVPIAGVCMGDIPDSAATLLIENSGTGCVYEEARGEGSLEKLKSFIFEKYNEWKETGITSCNPDWGVINQYEYSHLANKLNDLIVELTDVSNN